MITELYTTINLCLFANPNTQTTSSEGLTPGMHTYYEDRLIDNAEPYLVHDQFGDKYPIPKHGGKTIQFRKYSPLSKALTALTEGVTPDGNSLNMSTIEATVSQYGDYVTCSDVLELTPIDPQIEQATKLLGSQAGRTLDTITRDVITAGTNVMYAPKVSGSTVTEVLSRSALDNTAQLTYDLIFKAVAKLKSMNANPVDDSFVAIVHPNVACDLMLSDKWIGVHQYTNPENIYQGEVGKLAGVRFVETTEAKIFGPAVISDNKSRLTVKTTISSSTTNVAINEVLTAASGLNIPVVVNGAANTITAITTNSGATTITLGTAVTSLAAGAKISGEGATNSGESVYATMIIGANAYGVTDVSGGGLQHIVKQLGSAGSADPLNQRATTGWKALKVAERLVEENMIRIEHCSATEPFADAN